MTDCNVPNRTVFCHDNLHVLQGINSECIDLIYLDPPFNKNKKFTAPIGTSAEGAEFSDIFREEDIKQEWLSTIKEDHQELYHYLNGIKGVGKPYNFAYLAYMAIRLIECKRVLKSTGGIYLHCDPTMSHYLKTAMDCAFGEDNFRNEIIWHYYNGTSNIRRAYVRKHDVILFFAKDSKLAMFNEDAAREDYAPDSNFVKNPASYRSIYMPNPLGKRMHDVWRVPTINNMAKERTGYPTQKPLALLERIVEAGSEQGAMILDPFCGCATTCVAAERLERQWIGINISVKAYELVKERLTQEAADPHDLLKYRNEIHLKTAPPKRTDLSIDYREKKFVYVVSHPSYPGEYKVGIAKNWQTRLNAYQTSDPDRQYKIEFKLETPYFRETERHIHETFPNKHEWVQGGLKEIIDAINEYKGK